MGKSKSSSTNESIVNNKTINKSEVEILNQSTTENISNNIMSDSKSCASASAQSSEMEVGDIIVSGKSKAKGLKFNVEQDQKVNTSCIQETSQKVNLADKMAETMVNNISKTLDSATMVNMMSQAKSDAKTSGIAFGSASSKSSNKQTVNNETYNDSKTKLTNIVKNSIVKNTKQESFQQCVNQSFQSAKLKVGNIKISGESEVEDMQFGIKQAMTAMNSCIQKSVQMSDAISEIAKTIGVKIEEKTSVKSESTLKATAESSAANEGIGSMASLASFGSLGSGASIMVIGVIVAIIVAIIVFKFVM